MIWPVWLKVAGFLYELSASRFESSCSILHLTFHNYFEQVLDIQAIIVVGFTMKSVAHMIRTYSQRHRADKYSQDNYIIRPVWLKSSGFVEKLSAYQI